MNSVTRRLIDLRGWEFLIPGPKSRKCRCDLLISEGEVLILRAPNGAGKTTFLRALYEAVTCEGLGSDLSDPKLSRRTVFLPQHSDLKFWLPITLGEVAALSETQAQDAKLLPQEWRALSWNQSSGGERQRALIAQALGGLGGLLLLDEPFNHLDLSSRDLALRAICDWAKRTQGAAVIVAHGLEESDAVGTRSIALEGDHLR